VDRATKVTVLHQVDMDSKLAMEGLHKAFTADPATTTTTSTTR
jgi:hypothetical protein